MATNAGKMVPPKISTTWSPGIFALITLLAAAIGIGAMVFFFDPSTHGFYPGCQFHALTGLNCPGCGMTRALYALLHGNLRLALKDNALLLAALMIMGGRWVYQNWKGRPLTLVGPVFLWALLAVTIIFTVVRNLPGFDWLSP